MADEKGEFMISVRREKIMISKDDYTSYEIISAESPGAYRMRFVGKNDDDVKGTKYKNFDVVFLYSSDTEALIGEKMGVLNAEKLEEISRYTSEPKAYETFFMMPIDSKWGCFEKGSWKKKAKTMYNNDEGTPFRGSD